jgi:hypothetical protein
MAPLPYPTSTCFFSDVDPEVVGIALQIDHARRLERRAAKQAHRAISGVRHIDRIGRLHIADALRLLQAGDPLAKLARLEIDHAEAVIAKLGDEQPLPREIGRHVIDAALDGAERNFGFELERRRRRTWASASPAEASSRKVRVNIVFMVCSFPSQPNPRTGATLARAFVSAAGRGGILDAEPAAVENS